VTVLRSLLPAALLATLACASAPATPDKTALQVQDASLRQHYPLAVGNEWTYEASGLGGQKKRETIKIVRQEGAWFVDDHGGRLRIDSEGLRDADQYLLRPPLQTGTKWSAVKDLVVQRFEIVAADASEVTPAGTFLHCVTVRNEQPVGSQKAKFVTEWSYAPGVGLVRMRTQVDDGDKTVPQVSLALVEYRLVH
jgi:hypothetical protein